MVTIQDIAADLGLSAMTVSRALNGHPDVRTETRQRVEERARELKYRPNRWARSLVTRQSHLIGVVVPEISHTFFAGIMGGVQEAIEPEGYTLMLCHSGGELRRERREIDMLVGSRTDGLIVASAFPESDPAFFSDLAEQGVPFVLIDRFFERLDCPRARADDAAVGRLVAQHLLDLGHRRIAFIQGPPVSSATIRYQGFRDTLEQAGVPFPAEYAAPGGFTVEAGFDAMRRLLALPDRPTAVCAVNDPAAFGAIRACEEEGFETPRDISITGAGAIEPDYLPLPFLTTTAWSQGELGRQAGRMLLQLMRGESLETLEAVVEPRLIARRSTAAPPGAA